MVAAASFAGLTGCADSGPEMVAVDVDAPEVRLIDPGAGDSATVRWHDDGAEQEVTMSVTQGLGQQVLSGDGASGHAPLPDTTMNLPMEATVTGAEGDRTVDVTVGTPSGTDANLNDDIATADGFRMGYLASGRGVLEELKLGAPSGATETARAGVEASLTQWSALPIVFPEEAIGVGARWTVKDTVDGSDVNQTLTYTLMGRQGDMVDLGVEVEQTPTLTELKGQDGVRLIVADATTDTRAGRLTIDLGKPLPVTGEVTYVTEVTYADGEGPDAKPAVTQKFLRGLTFSAGKQ